MLKPRTLEMVSVFDIFKIGVGPSSSHTMGPWKAAQQFLKDIQQVTALAQVQSVQIFLYGSLAKTGKGHGTDIAILLGLSGENAETMDTGLINSKIASIKQSQVLHLLGQHTITFEYTKDLIFLNSESLAFHPNGMKFRAIYAGNQQFEQNYFSIGGGFIVKEGEQKTQTQSGTVPYPTHNAVDLLHWCSTLGKSISEVVLENEKYWRSETEIESGLLRIWQTMLECMFRGTQREGELPGGLKVKRRAAQLSERLLGSRAFAHEAAWFQAVKNNSVDFQKTSKWLSCFALAVNEENAAFGRVVTAPTNGAAGVIPSVLMYYACFCGEVTPKDLVRFLLVAGEIGSIFKKGATISAAMGGCQAEIGVSSAMAAAALTECLGGSPEQAVMAAEIAMEHHLGLTCDPIGGLVQIPCIERNSMGAIKAITAANIALESDPAHARVSLDGVIQTMMQTALDMSEKYKETSEGGLAVNVPINVIEC